MISTLGKEQGTKSKFEQDAKMSTTHVMYQAIHCIQNINNEI
jgi:hypothetical protein